MGEIDNDGLLEVDPKDPNSNYTVCSKILTSYKWDHERGYTSFFMIEEKRLIIR
ncbi:hypothetical protein [Clostridium estertheticum]|uniref:hypothetical protein n=1 Tax=Clostridium estertheticum TaxID=238834 RepID=UPI000A711F4F|nr:hypothetical protein [Clostridium estertheticum]MBU3171168.1 hypothetical protein [Clostridium estertheticum]MBU3183275.1 hypothetical protein [Clostridium estertheticum]MBZ9614752.1 hypothetical protein [Clostridium estertheticum subsp. laramiense]